MKARKMMYLDTCIFVRVFLKETDHEKVEKFLKDNQSDVDFVTSDWTLTEIVKVLIKDKKKPPKKVSEYVQELIRTSRLGGIKFEFLKMSTKENYDFGDFFYDIQKMLLRYKGSLGDAIHTVIMKNRDIKTIVSTDSEFEGRKGILIINPLKL